MELLAKPKVDETIPPYLALNKYLVQFDDFATQVNQADTDDNHGLSHLLYSAADFLALKGTAPIVPQDPGDFTADMVGGLLELHKERKSTFKRFRVGAVYVSNTFEAGLSTHFKELLIVNHSMNHLTTAEQVSTLKARVLKTKDDLTHLRQAIAKPFAHPMRIETHVRHQLENIAHLARAGQPLAPQLAIASMLVAFESNEADKQDYQLAKTQFAQEHGEDDQQTPDIFAAFMCKFVNQRLPDHRVTQTAKRAAYAAIQADTDAANVELAALRTAATQPPPAHPKAGAPNKKASKKGNLPVRLTARALLAGAPAWYCHSCGADFQLGYEHYSCECRDRKPGHQKHATFTNQMGGKRA